MKAKIASDLVHTNLAFEASEVTLRLRLVGTHEVDYTEAGSLPDDLAALTMANDGFLDEVHIVRREVGADDVTLYVYYSNTATYGTANIMTTLDSWQRESAFNVVWSRTHWKTTAHEIGHNLGCDHDADHATTGGLFPFSRGHRFEGDDGAVYRTIMAYRPGARIDLFSNPGLVFQGVPAGDEMAADNARSLNAAAPVAADFFDANAEDAGYFMRGDANADGTFTIADAVWILLYLFRQGSTPACLSAADANDDGAVNVGDAVCLLTHFFVGGAAIPDPHPDCGTDLIVDDLDCRRFPPCRH